MDRPLLTRQTDGQLNKLQHLPLPAVHLFLLYRGEGPGPCPPSSPAPLVVNWAPARPRPFIASICQSLRAWMLPETLYKSPPISPIALHLYYLSLSPSNRANRSDPGQFRANSGSTKTVVALRSVCVGLWLMSSPTPPRSVVPNLSFKTQMGGQTATWRISPVRVDLKAGDRCTVGGIVWRQSRPVVRLSSAHVLLPFPCCAHCR